MQRLKVTVSCPSCGAPIEFLEGSNVSCCPFCNLPLFFQSPEKVLSYYLESKLSQREIPFIVDRFRKEQEQPLSSKIQDIKLYYLPFWRFSTQVFYSRVNLTFLAPQQEEKEVEILTKDWDTNFPAHLSNDLGLVTLGMRPDWLKLRLLTDLNCLKQGQILDLETNPSEAREKALRGLDFLMQSKKSAEDELILKLLDENLSLIYFPLWVVNFITEEEKYYQVIDGVVKRTLLQKPGYFDLRLNEKKENKPSYTLKIIPHRCPNCGADFKVADFHLVFPCDNCRKIWRISEQGYQPVQGELVAPSGEKIKAQSKSIEYYPFWVFEASPQKEKNFNIEKLAELFPSEIGWFMAKDKSRPFLFYIPAFEIKNLNKIPSISLAFTRIQPQLEEKNREQEKLQGAIRSDEDAKKLAELLWLGLLYSKMNLDVDEWKDLNFGNAKIIWYPFQQEGAFLTDLFAGYSFQKASWGQNPPEADSVPTFFSTP